MSSRIQDIHSAADLVERTAKTLGLVDFSFRLTIKIGRGQGCCGGHQGGKPFINISTNDRYHDVKKFAESIAHESRLNRVWQKAVNTFNSTGIAYSCEYASIDSRREIGGIHSNDSKLVLLSVVCHEVAHAIIYHNKDNFKNGYRPHGSHWQEYYRALRNALVNPYLNTAEELPEMRVAAFVKPTPAVKPLKRPAQGTATGRVWEIADANPTVLRAYIIELCIQAGIAKGTASTQYSKWKKFNAR